jgi:PBS lyase HEAT-like repeat
MLPDTPSRHFDLEHAQQVHSDRPPLDDVWPRDSENCAGQDCRASAIIDPEDLQPLSLLPYFCAYLEANPEAAVRRHFQRHPEIGSRALRFLLHREVLRIIEDPDLARRAERLMPHFRTRRLWGYRCEAAKAIEACGPAAGPCLLASLETERSAAVRSEIMSILGRLRFRPAVVPLIRLLESGDAWLVAWMARGDPTAQLSSGQANVPYSDVIYAAYALGLIGDPRAEPTLRKTLARWTRHAVLGEQITETCREALEKLEGK